MTKSGFLNILSLSLVGAGLSVLAPLGLLNHGRSMLEDSVKATAVVSSVTTASHRTKDIISGVPTHIDIPKLSISTNIKNGYYDVSTRNWTIDETSAFFATITQPVNNVEGNTFIYAHNSDILFGRLPKISPGEKAVVTTDNGYRFTYRHTYSESLRPAETQALDYQGEPRLSLQTCSGLWSQYRHMFYFELVGYEKI